MTKTWTEEAEKTAREMWASHSAAEISAKLAEAGFEFSRNSVISKMKRMKMPPKVAGRHPSSSVSATPGFGARKQVPVGSTAFKVIHAIKRMKRQPKIRPEPFACKPVPHVIPMHVSLMDLAPDGCHWPYGDVPAEITFCNHTRFGSSSYCEEHFKLSLGKGTPSERNAHRVAA